MTNERKKQLSSALFTDEAAAQAALQMTPEQVQAKLAESGLTYSVEEIKEFGKELAAAAKKVSDGEELTAEELQSVAGGLMTGISSGESSGVSKTTIWKIVGEVISIIFSW